MTPPSASRPWRDSPPLEALLHIWEDNGVITKAEVDHALGIIREVLEELA
jgi:hypothetical protein